MRLTSAAGTASRITITMSKGWQAPHPKTTPLNGLAPISRRYNRIAFTVENSLNQLRSKMLAGFVAEVRFRMGPKSYLRRQRSYPPCRAIQLQNNLMQPWRHPPPWSQTWFQARLRRLSGRFWNHSIKALADASALKMSHMLPLPVREIDGNKIDRSAKPLPGAGQQPTAATIAA